MMLGTAYLPASLTSRLPPTLLPHTPAAPYCKPQNLLCGRMFFMILAIILSPVLDPRSAYPHLLLPSHTTQISPGEQTSTAISLSRENFSATVKSLTTYGIILHGTIWQYCPAY
jgi:hypothetical protein